MLVKGATGNLFLTVFDDHKDVLIILESFQWTTRRHRKWLSKIHLNVILFQLLSLSFVNQRKIINSETSNKNVFRQDLGHNNADESLVLECIYWILYNEFWYLTIEKW